MSALPATQPGVSHRPMVARDIDTVLAMEITAYSHPWTRGNFIDSLAAGYTAELRLDAQTQLLGYWVAMPGFEESHLLNITVAPVQQGRGHGWALLERLKHWSVARDDQALLLEVRQSNAGARRLYTQFGFVQIGVRRDYYPAGRLTREDAVVMRLDLSRA
jgi:ribosomal-protein-alanine N-acetyltransferase